MAVPQEKRYTFSLPVPVRNAPQFSARSAAIAGHSSAYWRFAICSRILRSRSAYGGPPIFLNLTTFPFPPGAIPFAYFGGFTRFSKNVRMAFPPFLRTYPCAMTAPVVLCLWNQSLAPDIGWRLVLTTKAFLRSVGGGMLFYARSGAPKMESYASVSTSPGWASMNASAFFSLMTSMVGPPYSSSRTM